MPRTPEQAAALFRTAADMNITVIPRGAGTGLTGGAIGEGLVVDFARYNRRISDLNIDQRTVRVQSGVILDQLNAFLRPHGYWFGPDVATSARATLGGMIGNNSSGAYVAVYGTTVDHVVSLDVVLADGTLATIGRKHDTLPEHRRVADRVIPPLGAELAGRFNPALLKRLPGYGFDDYLKQPGDLTRIVTGSEGTLAGIVSAELNIVPLPKRRGMGILFFPSVEEAMQATVEILDLHPAAIEHVDHVLFDQTRDQLAFREARSLMQLDTQPCDAFLIVEFFDDADDKLNELNRRQIGLRKLICADTREQELVRAFRKAGLTLLTSCPGDAKPVTIIEDVCIPPERLPEYVAGLKSLIKPLGIEASFYGHANSGELHVRPKLNLHSAEDIAKFRQIAEGVSSLCRQFKGSLAGEHGVGIARAEFMPEHLGPALLDACRQIKASFDPKNILNPGKIVPDGRYRIDRDLRYGPGHRIELPFAPRMGFVDRDKSFVANLEQCNGCGGCRKDTPTMCPTFIVTQEEIMSTRGRANTIRAVLEHRLAADARHPLASYELEKALSNCLSCKACKSECPSNVDLAALKADLLHAKHQQVGVSLQDRLIAKADLLGRIGSATAPLSNIVLQSSPVRLLLSAVLGFAKQRRMPAYASQRFDRWFAARPARSGSRRGSIILWDDTWVRYHEPNIGQAAVSVLEAAGFEIRLAEGRKCCGRPAASRGLLDEVVRLGRHNLTLLTATGDDPIVFLEPSCYSMFVDDYRQLQLPNADRVAARCVLFEPLLCGLLEREPNALRFGNEPIRASIHAHCHAKALIDTKVMTRLVQRIPNAEATMLDTACCGMAGAFGMLKEKYELSTQLAQPMVDKINALPPDTHLVASGTSCRHQITHQTTARPLHMAELIAMAIKA